MSIHVFISWLLATLLYPVLLVLYLGGADSFDLEVFTFLFGFFFYTVIFSFPSLVLSLLVMVPIAKSPITNSSKFIIWCIAAMLAVLVNFYLIFYLILKEDIFRSASIELILPALLAVSITILCRYKYFFTALSKLETVNNSFNETESES